MPIIPIISELENFKTYLEHNDRCILSARFGDGKSYFISQFINKHKDDYLFIPIYPVNYQVADNKDIFEYIKRDILIRLITSYGVDIDECIINKSWILWSFFSNNKYDIATNLLATLPKINLLGIELSFEKTVKAINTLKSKYEEYSQKFQSNSDKIEEYIASFTKSNGSIYEFDAISQLICDLNDQYKQKHQEKKIVLIIEDLDRIDPAHIFRILNVLSAHFDRFDITTDKFEKTHGVNKFKFDKIITVCHYENIKNIYSHMYGAETDFNGYIDKFSKSKPFYYSLRSHIKSYILRNIDDELSRYSFICNVLGDLILKKYENTSNNIHGSLRFIRDSLRQEYEVKCEEIEVLGTGYNILSSNSFTKLLVLLNRFEITFKEFESEFFRVKYFDNSDKQKARKELYKIIGVSWLILPSLNKTFAVNINHKSIVSFFINSYGIALTPMIINNIILEIDIEVIVDHNDQLVYFERCKHDILLFFSSYIVNFNSKILK